MLQTWRWFGPEDPVTLNHARQAGVRGIVTALHDIYDGRAWTADNISTRQAYLAEHGYRWDVCESIPVPNAIKLSTKDATTMREAWKTTLSNLGRAGVKTVAYNFMPVVDWTRTNLRFETKTGGLALRFDMYDFIAYDVFILERPDAAANYTKQQVDAAKARFENMNQNQREQLEANIIAGLPGNEGGHTRGDLLVLIAQYIERGEAELRSTLYDFVAEMSMVAAENDIKLAIHPDDPPFPLFGLPRIVSTADDIRHLRAAVPEPANGLTFCVGSYSSRADNDVVAMVQEFAPFINFAHLRNVTCDEDGSFMESDHLDGDADMVKIVTILMAEQARRRAENPSCNAIIPMRPDHGHLLLDDREKKTNPGYSGIGRLKGLAELRGVMATVDQLQKLGLSPLTLGAKQ